MVVTAIRAAAIGPSARMGAPFLWLHTYVYKSWLAKFNTPSYETFMARPRSHSFDDWLMAGFRALVREGPGAIRAEALARDMGVSKGGFYGTFDGVPGFRDAMMDRWQQLAVRDVIDQLDHVAEARMRLDLLIDFAAAAEPDDWGGPLVEPAIRGWALASAEVAAAVRSVDAERTAWLIGVFDEIGRSAAEARLFHAAYVGYVTLGRGARDDMARDLRAYLARQG